MIWQAGAITFGFLFFLFSLTPPAYHYFRLLLSDYKRPEITRIENWPEITIVIPARDEAFLIRNKLEEILGIEYPKSKLNILVIDSASEDATKDISEDFLSENLTKEKWRVIRIPSPGKSLAINHALDAIETEFFILTDVDSSLPPNSFIDSISLLSTNVEIGAVCGSLSVSEGIYMEAYRSRFNFLRLRESHIFSTPILEGSICAFRKSAISKDRIDEKINADDSQLALICYRNGFRAIMHDQINFTEPKFPASYQRTRSLRRAQGIVRVLFKNKDLAFGKDRFNGIFLHNLYFYVLMPWLALIGVMILLYGVVSAFSQGSVGIGLFIGAAISIISITISKTIRSFFSGLILLAISQILLLSGKRLSEWKPYREFA